MDFWKGEGELVGKVMGSKGNSRQCSAEASFSWWDVGLGKFH
jgi:hypothetical protein